MIYGFRCDCGAHALEEFSANDPEKKVHCPKCGAWMWRDFSSIAIGGDLPTRRPGAMCRAFSEADLGPEGKLMGEVDYIEKHAAPDQQHEASAVINAMGSEFRNEQRKEQVEEKYRNLRVEIPKGFDI